MLKQMLKPFARAFTCNTLLFLFSDFARLEFVAGQQFVRFQEALSNSEKHANVKALSSRH